MPWFKIDDGFHCHPKVFAAGTPAVGLYVRCGSWAAQQTSEGIIPKQVAKLYGTPRMIKALVDAGLWHAAGHDCESCPELDANSYVIHQFLERNPSRVEVESARKLKSARQQRWREGKKNDQVNGGEGDAVDADVDASTREHGDAAPIPPRPNPTQASPTEKPASKAAGPQVPDFARELVAQMTDAGMVVGWRLGDTEWFAVHAHIKRCGIPAMVAFARRRWNPADPPQTARYLTRIWADLPDMPQPEAGLPALRAVAGSPAPISTTDQRVQQGLDLAARFRALEGGQP